MAHLYETIRTSPGSYLPFMEHIARRDGRVRSKVRVRVARTELPVLTPAQVDALIAAEATWNAASQSWDGDLRYRLLWSLLAETGMRLGEALAIQHHIEQHRSAGRTTASPAEPSDDAGTSGAVRALTAQIKALRAAAHKSEVARLVAALAAAHGENLQLRRQVAHFDDVARQRLPDGRAEVAGDRA